MKAVREMPRLVAELNAQFAGFANLAKALCHHSDSPFTLHPRAGVWRVISAPTVRHRSAQGNALGTRHHFSKP
jgi:hypothetical protein